MVKHEARLAQGDNGQFVLSGDVVFSTTPDLYAHCKASLKSASDCSIDCSQIQNIDGSCLALLIQLRRDALTHAHALIFANVPKHLVSLASLSGLDSVLGFKA